MIVKQGSPGEVEAARSLIRAEADALRAVADSLDDRFSQAVMLVERCAGSGGSVLVSGLGKSGLVGAKIAATMSSLGIPSHFIHPAEAVHGDLGRFRRNDLLVAISASGETDEVVNLAAIVRQDGLPIIAITCRPRGALNGSEEKPSSLARLATVTLALHVEREACEPEFAAPTSSTTATMALGDALAVAAARRRAFTDAEFARRHPGGALGGLLRSVTDVMRFVAGRNLPLIPADMPVMDAMHKADEIGRRPGCLVIVDPGSGRLAGIFTDGDFRRLVLRDARAMMRPIGDVMTRNPRTLQEEALARDAVRLFRENRQDEIPIVDAGGRPVGVLDVQDLVALRLVSD